MADFPLSTIRHSASHVLAQAVQQLFPDAGLGIGPSIDDGFYYDFKLPRALTPDDLEDLENRMKAIIKENQAFKTFNLTRAEAVSKMKENGQEFKEELINDLDLPEYSFWENGPFVDLCRGPHVRYTKQIGAIKLLKVSGAYWRGDEKRPMLQRIYGTAFQTKAELEEYLTRLEEAKKRDHRLIGRQLKLFQIHEDIGGGLINWMPKGARIRHEIESYWRDAHLKNGYDLVYTPHMGRSVLWERSGHLGFYNENMFAPMEVENQSYILKPMNCPFHILIYEESPKSYRDLPVRYAELGTVYRYERSGVLQGLFRVRGFTQDDAHIMCTHDQCDTEIETVMSFCLGMLKDFGFTDSKFYLSTRPETKYVGELSDWQMAENALENSLKKMGLAYETDIGGGAFYGPKIDIKIKDAIGREWQCSTIQFDFNLPERFDMTYIGSDGKKHRPIMIHRALLGSIERFFGILIEHHEGRFPLWLAPVQVKLLTVSPEYNEYAKTVAQQLKAANIRVELDNSEEKIGYKIREAANELVPIMGIIGAKEREAGTLSLRKRGEGDVGQLPVNELIQTIIGTLETHA